MRIKKSDLADLNKCLLPLQYIFACKLKNFSSEELFKKYFPVEHLKHIFFPNKLLIFKVCFDKRYDA